MPPLVCQFGIVDQATAIMASHQIITALYMRERYGEGQEVHVSMLGTAIYLLYFNVLMAQGVVAGRVSGRVLVDATVARTGLRWRCAK